MPPNIVSWHHVQGRAVSGYIMERYQMARHERLRVRTYPVLFMSGSFCSEKENNTDDSIFRNIIFSCNGITRILSITLLYVLIVFVLSTAMTLFLNCLQLLSYVLWFVP